MMFKKGLGCEINGFQVPNVPRAPRSIRRTTLHQRKVGAGEACAFELLASLAGKLLQDGESSDSSNASEALGLPNTGNDGFKAERQFEGKPVKLECVDQGSSNLSIVGFNSSNDSKLRSHDENNFFMEQTSANKNFGHLDKCLTNLEGDSCIVKTENRSGIDKEAEGLGLVVLTMRSKACFPKDTLSDSGIAPLQMCRDHICNASFPRHRKVSKLGTRDDDEKSCRFSRINSRFKASRPPLRAGDRRIRKLLTSRYWKSAPKLKDYEFTGTDGGRMPFYQKRRNYFNHERSQYASVLKKRKFYDQSSALTSEGGLSSESVSNSPVKEGNRGIPPLLMQEDVLTGDQVCQTAQDSHVKFSIKSFRVPELFVEVPETATVGSLKSTVMEAVTALLGAGVRVGLLSEGKKVRDDSRTLSQIGISCKDDLDTVGFTLEPNPAQAPPALQTDDHPLPLSCDATNDLTRSQTSPVDSEIPEALPGQLEHISADNKHVDSNHDIVSSSTDYLTDQSEPDSRALVPVPPMDVGALSAIPVSQQKLKKSELAPRRIRRPFSVSEVEALVHAVEELGTGRWRDVKLRAFEDADHRTYVDLKDKWKTLVHTARIAPQQRRGEPVPQELLNRVLAAHAYWSENQGKQQTRT